ncbi:TetR/AcrR family transcriptional regulator [Nocardia nova]|uniref:TetR/AcrR family transcriptional regulator n=1 Tax=Nocardia nova TaxID=37330 RepID=UPI0018944BB2|nr:TetR/AcrR family transcriptional regulator [Nocardia nova]MBF6149535.1 TetR family transcriptional regulator [Nocardia nova]
MTTTSPMNATRERILAAAAHILSRRGVAGTRLADIAAHAELRAPAVYYYFRSRNELIAEVMREGQRRVREHVQHTITSAPPGAPVVELIDAAVEAHLRIELGMSDFASAVTRNAGQLPPEIVESLRLESTAYHAIWRTLLERLAESGELRPGLDIGIARMLVIGALNWTAEWWNPDHGSLDSLVATAQSIVRNSVAIQDTPDQQPRAHPRPGSTRSTCRGF